MALSEDKKRILSSLSKSQAPSTQKSEKKKSSGKRTVDFDISEIKSSFNKSGYSSSFPGYQNPYEKPGKSEADIKSFEPAEAEED